MNEKTLLVNEIFGPTYQGEGPATGKLCAFVRLAICPLNCSWCDTAYTWAYTPTLAARHQSKKQYNMDEEVHEMKVQDVADRAREVLKGGRIVVISGGEPLAQVPPRLQDPKISAVVDGEDPVAMLAYKLYIHNIAVHIETAGIRFPSSALVAYTSRFVVSPKLESSGNSLVSRRKMDVLAWFAQSRVQTDFKFVITGPEDLKEVDHLVKYLGISPGRVWLMPEGTTSGMIALRSPKVAEMALEQGYNFSSRLHVQLWGDKRGH